MNDHPKLNSEVHSRFVQRWLQAAPARADDLKYWSQLSLDTIDFQAMLEQQRLSSPSLAAALRRLRNLLVCAIIERDLSKQADLAEVLAAISNFADFSVRAALAQEHALLCELHGEPYGEESGLAQQLLVIAMGKLGGQELNVSSDIDLIFLYAEGGDTRPTRPEQRQLSNHEFFLRLGQRLIAVLSAITDEGFVFRVDMALRPNGASGPLAASFAMLEDYLVVQGREWERYAWMKARALTGSPQELQALDALVQPFVYRRYLDYGSIHALRGMHAQIRAEVRRQEIRHPERSVNVKLGRGGIREIEFLTQVFQMIRGGRDRGLRDRSTRTTLQTLADKNLLPVDTVSRLFTSYQFLRNVEHRLQYLDDAQTHVLPRSEGDQAAIAAMLNFSDVASMRAAISDCCDWVAAQFDAMFEDKDLEQDDEHSDTLGPALVEIDLATLSTYLSSLGFDDAEGSAQRLLRTWQSSRIQSMPEHGKRQLHSLMRMALPMVARHQGACAATLNRLVDLFEAIARRAAYLALLSEFPHALERVIRIMAASEWAARYLIRHPLLMDELLDDSSLHAAPDWPTFTQQCAESLHAVAGDTERQMDVLRDLHHAQLFRLLAQDLGGRLSMEVLADQLSALADIVVDASLTAVWENLASKHRPAPAFAIIAYGKLGGKELSYASDLDVIFLYDDLDPEAPAIYAKLAQRFITWMTSHTPAGVLFDIDIALRPDGASGLLVSSFSAFEKYQSSSAWVWEHQALTRARFCAGDKALGQRFEALRVQLLCQPREPEALRSEVLTMRHRLHEAHVNRGELFDLKQDVGGMIDIEFIMQYLVLAHSHQHPSLSANSGNIALLKLAADLGLIPSTSATQVADAYRHFRTLQHQLRLRGEDQARVTAQEVGQAPTQVQTLWQAVFYPT
jgi:glutamate-ammonia-ligase adenylyltransferase